MTICTLRLSDALAELPTHADRLAAALEIKKLTGQFPWGVADEANGDRPDISAAVLVAGLRRARAGLPALEDLMGEWREWTTPARVWLREPIGLTLAIASVFSRTLSDGDGWVVCQSWGLGVGPSRGPAHSEAGKVAADTCLMVERGLAVLDGEEIRYAC